MGFHYKGQRTYYFLHVRICLRVGSICKISSLNDPGMENSRWPPSWLRPEDQQEDTSKVKEAQVELLNLNLIYFIEKVLPQPHS